MRPCERVCPWTSRALSCTNWAAVREETGNRAHCLQMSNWLCKLFVPRSWKSSVVRENIIAINAIKIMCTSCVKVNGVLPRKRYLMCAGWNVPCPFVTPPSRRFAKNRGARDVRATPGAIITSTITLSVCGGVQRQIDWPSLAGTLSGWWLQNEPWYWLCVDVDYQSSMAQNYKQCALDLDCTQ